MINSRQKYIDYTKGFGIIMIIFAHCTQSFLALYPANFFVCSFHVPIFFIASGILSNKVSMKYSRIVDLIKTRFHSLLIPYMIFSAINSLIKMTVLGLTGQITSDSIKSETIELLLIGNGTVWFLMTLFLTEILFFFVRYCVIITKLFIMILCLILPFAVNDYCINPLHVFVIRVVAALGYFIVGYLLCEIMDRMREGSYILLVGIVLMVLGGIVYCYLGSDFSFYDGKFNNIVGSLSCSICLSCGVVLAFKYLDNKNINLRILDYYGRNSLVVMLVHPIILLCFTYPLGTFFVSLTGVNSAIGGFVMVSVILILMIPAIWVVNRWFPALVGKKSLRKTDEKNR